MGLGSFEGGVRTGDPGLRGKAGRLNAHQRADAEVRLRCDGAVGVAFIAARSFDLFVSVYGNFPR